MDDELREILYAIGENQKRTGKILVEFFWCVVILLFLIWITLVVC